MSEHTPLLIVLQRIFIRAKVEELMDELTHCSTAEENQPIRRVPPRPEDQELIKRLTDAVAGGACILF